MSQLRIDARGVELQARRWKWQIWLSDAQGNPISGHTASQVIVASTNGSTNADGVGTVDLPPNASITSNQANPTYYSIRLGTHEFVFPKGDGPEELADIVVDTPPNFDPATRLIDLADFDGGLADLEAGAVPEWDPGVNGWVPTVPPTVDVAGLEADITAASNAASAAQADADTAGSVATAALGAAAGAQTDADAAGAAAAAAQSTADSKGVVNEVTAGDDVVTVDGTQAAPVVSAPMAQKRIHTPKYGAPLRGMNVGLSEILTSPLRVLEIGDSITELGCMTAFHDNLFARAGMGKPGVFTGYGWRSANSTFGAMTNTGTPLADTADGPGGYSINLNSTQYVEATFVICTGFDFWGVGTFDIAVNGVTVATDVVLTAADPRWEGSTIAESFNSIRATSKAASSKAWGIFVYQKSGARDTHTAGPQLYTLGNSGSTTANQLAWTRNIDMATFLQPHVIFVQTGMNDGSAANYLTQMGSWLDALRAACPAASIVLTFPHLAGNSHGWLVDARPHAYTLTREKGAHLIDMAEVFGVVDDFDTDLWDLMSQSHLGGSTYDFVHPSARGNAVWSETVSNNVLNYEPARWQADGSGQTAAKQLRVGTQISDDVALNPVEPLGNLGLFVSKADGATAAVVYGAEAPQTHGAALVTHTQLKRGICVYPPPKTGQWAYPHHVTRTTLALTVNRLYYLPFYVPDYITIDQLGVEVTTLATSGGTIRILGYSKETNHWPGARAVNPTAVATDAGSTGTMFATATGLAWAVAPGLHYLACVAQTAAVTVRASADFDAALPGVSASTDVIGTTLANSFFQASVSGTPPATASTSPSLTTTTPIVFYKRA